MKKSNKKEETAVERPVRPEDYVSKRGIPYWWSPEWVRDLNGTMSKIKAIKNKKGDVDLFMKSKTGKLTFIQGSIQAEFKKWHQDRSIDYILLGEDPDQLLEEIE